MPALNGHGLGKKVDSADARDFLYGMTREAPAHLPHSVDLRKSINLPVADQLDTNSCGGQAASAMMTAIYPQAGRFSALQIYYATRQLEGDPGQDDGVETRDLLKVLNDVGAVPESAWPFNPAKVLAAPPDSPPHIKIGSYARLVGAADMLGCLASGFPFILGFMVPKSLDGDQVMKTGILPRPDLKTDPIIGGHDTLCVGFDATFKQTPFFKASGIDPALVDDTMLLIRNSWGDAWSPTFRGHFWMPLSYAVNPSTGGDAWTARSGATALVGASPVPPIVKPRPTPAQLAAAQAAGFASMRRALDTETSYGSWVSDDKLRPVANDVAAAVAAAVVSAGNS
jgi:C1A family cysteine protease